MNRFHTGLFGLAIACGTCFAQTETPAAPAATPALGATSIHTGVPSRDTLLRVSRKISVDFNEQRLEDIVKFIKDASAADIEPMWMDERNSEGLDKEKVITVKADNMSCLAVIEKVLEKAHPDAGGEATWQMSEQGSMQIGPRSRLNKYRRIQIYDINDLLMEVPDYREVPRIDLQQALQASQGGGGGGGGQSPFRNENERDDQNMRTKLRQDKADDLASLIRDLVETEQWTENGGSGGSIKYYQGTLIVNAADYIHRGINGYSWWPSSQTIATKTPEGRRYVTLNADTGLSKVTGFGQQPVTAVVGGTPISSGGPGGGGSPAKPPSKPAPKKPAGGGR